MAGGTAESWSGRAAFIMASIGAAVGLGNIWKFPYTLGNSGGSAFVLIYVLAMLLIATPIMLSEMVIGRHARMSAPSAMRKVAVDSGTTRTHENLPDQRLTDIYFFGRWSPVNKAPTLFDCAGARSAILIDGAQFADDGTVINADWQAVPPDDPILRHVCET